MSIHTENQWHYTDGTSSFGPLSTSVIRQLITTGVIAPGFHLCRDGDEHWTPLDHVNLDVPAPAQMPPNVPPPPGPATQTKNPLHRYYFDVWKKYAVFTGRASRKEFWMFNLFSFIALNILGLLEGRGVEGGQLMSMYLTALLCPPLFVLQAFMCLFIGGLGGMLHAYGIGYLGLIYGLAVFLPSVAVAARRINDSARSVWMLLCPLGILIFSLVGGTRGPNRHGPDPRMTER